MDVRFEDHAGFQRAAALSALGASAAAALAAEGMLVAVAVVGSAVALAVEPGLSPRERARRAVVAAAAGGLAVLARAGAWAPVALCGALLGLAFAAARADASRRAGSAAPSGALVALAAALCGVAVLLGLATLPALAAALQLAAPRWVANAAAGAALGLWAALGSAPLHVVFGADPVESRLAALRPLLQQELRVLAERAVAALRGATLDLPRCAPELRGLLEQLALSALSVAERAGSLDRAAAPLLEDDLQRRFRHLEKSAVEATDPAARQSYQRAAEALDGQLEHFRRVRRARDRAVAQLHEDVANLERARFSLTLLRGTEQGAAELDLLRDRLEHRAVAFEAEEELAAPRGVRAV